MKKLLLIFSIFTITTLPALAATKKITVDWELTLPVNEYVGWLYVYDLDGQCTYENGDKQEEHKIWYLYTSKKTKGKTTLICPSNKNELTLIFDFYGGKNQEPYGLALSTSAKPANYLKTLDISKLKKHEFKATIETLHDKQVRHIEEIAGKYCETGYKFHSLNNNVFFCCIDGYKNPETSALIYELENLIGNISVSLITDCNSSVFSSLEQTPSVPTTPAVESTETTSTEPTAISDAKEVTDTRCNPDTKNGITEKKDYGGVCAPTKCLTPRWELSGNDKRAKCVEQKCEFKHGTGEWTADGNTWKCTLKTCKNGYDKNENDDACIEQLKKCTDAQNQQHPNATKTGLKKGTQTCIAQECKCGFKLKNDACVAWDENESCTRDTKPALPRNANSAIMKCDGKKAYCKITDCKDGYKHNEEKNKCSRAGESDTDEDDDKATKDSSQTDGDDEQTQPNEPSPSETDSQAKIDELRDNAEAMRAKEQSTANKLLGAAAIGTTGIGAMQTASAMAEQNADADAERTMRAYLATFHCNYGAGKSIQGGQSNIDLPGGNELIGLYSEYVNLANDLKVRKNALNIRPGIESEPILDAATSGLYDDVAIGKTSGAYTSLARALMDPNGADAAAWAQQKSDTADRKKAGMITAGIGVAGSLAANLAINSGKNKQNKVDEILNKYDKKKQLITELESNIAALPPQIVPCPTDTTGEKQPNCTCNDNTKFFNPKTTKCEDCPGDMVAIDGKCKCPSDKPLSAPDSDKCYTIPQQCTPECDRKSDPNLQVLIDCTCTCKNYFDYKDGKCTCEGANKRIVNDQCQTVTVETVTETEPIVEHILTETETIIGATLPTDSLFELGKSTLRSDAKSHISNFIRQLSDDGYTNCSIQIDGYTDPLGKTAQNKTLSQQRANAVKKYISDLNNNAINSITANGHGETDCTCGTGTAQNKQIDYDNPEYQICKGKADEYELPSDARYAPCRRVIITPTCNKTTTTVTKQ